LAGEGLMKEGGLEFVEGGKFAIPASHLLPDAVIKRI
jgi:hypothetical protein